MQDLSQVCNPNSFELCREQPAGPESTSSSFHIPCYDVIDTIVRQFHARLLVARSKLHVAAPMRAQRVNSGLDFHSQIRKP